MLEIISLLSDTEKEVLITSKQIDSGYHRSDCQSSGRAGWYRVAPGGCGDAAPQGGPSWCAGEAPRCAIGTGCPRRWVSQPAPYLLWATI